MISKFRTVVRHYLYELVLALFKMAAIFCQARCDNSGVGTVTCALTDAVPSR